MKIQVLGKGCPKCQKLEENVREAISQVDSDIALEKVYDIQKASKMGMMSAPGLAVDGELKRQGQVLEPGEIVEIIEGAA